MTDKRDLPQLRFPTSQAKSSLNHRADPIRPHDERCSGLSRCRALTRQHSDYALPVSQYVGDAHTKPHARTRTTSLVEQRRIKVASSYGPTVEHCARLVLSKLSLEGRAVRGLDAPAMKQHRREFLIQSIGDPEAVKLRNSPRIHTITAWFVTRERRALEDQYIVASTRQL
jgi:hypothetical protein